jgi:RNA polymerase sigma factor (TIGR02999 family)
MRSLAELSRGDGEGLDRIMPLVYDELRRIARHYLGREQPGHTLQPTALVHEAYLRLADQTDLSWQSRAHFFSIAAAAMRRILVEHSRKRHSLKRGGSVHRLTLDETVDWAGERTLDTVALDDALSALSRIDPQKSRMVELRFFGGLTIDETAEVLSLSAATVERGWHIARLWLQRELQNVRHEP